MAKWIALALILTGLQGAFWYETHKKKPDLSIVPDVPGRETVQALSLGDEHFFFRLLGLQLQSAGDTFGRFTALNKYDFNKLYHWFRLLDHLDDQSNYIPSMATYYYSQTQHKPDVKYVVDYLIEHAAHRVEEKWWWLIQAIYLSNHKLEDRDLSLKIAKMLQGDYDIPLWARQMPAFIYEQRGELDAALAIIQELVESEEDITQHEFNFMRHFVEERLERVKEAEALHEEQRRRKAEQQSQPSGPPGESAN